MKTFKAYRAIEEKQVEEKRRAAFEEGRQRTLSETLWKSYNNNVKLWSLRVLNEKGEKIS